MNDSLTIRLRVADTPVQLDFSPGHGELATEIGELWAHLVDHGPASGVPAIRRFYARSTSERSVGGGSRVVTPGPGAGYAVSGDITKALLESLVSSRLLLHAGTVHHDRLGVVTVVGASGAGKSTATLTLGREGRYLTDELTILDPEDLHVTAYPKPLSRAGEGHLKRDHALSCLGLVHATSAPRPDLVVLLARSADAEPRLERVPHAEALLTLIEQSSSTWTVPKGLVRLGELLEGTGGAVRAHYRDAQELSVLLSTLPPRLPSGDLFAVPQLAPAEPRDGQVALTPVAQALGVEDGFLLLDIGRALHLTGLGALIWELLSESGPLLEDDLAARVVGALGEHPRAHELMRLALESLRSQELLARG